MKKVELGNNKYVIEKNINDCFNFDDIKELYTDYFEGYDYVFGDYSYDKLRLKGFCNKDNTLFNDINDIKQLDDYIKDFCSYKSNYFLLKKIK